MSSLRKLVPATAIAAAAMALPAAAMTTMTRSPMYFIDDGVRISPVMMVVAVSLVLALVYTLWKLLPRIRSGELSSSKLGFKGHGELLSRKSKGKVRSEDDCSSADMV